MLILHIGLPKTGTTFLQYQVFAQAPSIVYMHRKRSKSALSITRGLRTFSQTRPSRAHELRTSLVQQLKRIKADGRPVVISDENVGISPRLFWASRTATPEKVARRIALLRKSLPQEHLPLRILMGIREQDQWLASFYAQVSLSFPDFGQEDFDQRMITMAALDKEDPSLGWLDYQRTRKALVDALGAENVLLLPLERLSGAPDETFKQLSAFLGGADLLGEKTAEITRQPRNQLSAGDDIWRLRRDGTLLRLDLAIRSALRQRFAASNQVLASEMPLGFGAPD